MGARRKPASYERIRARLDDQVYGQDEAKDALAGAATLQAGGVSSCPALLVGATGTGKTLLAHSLAGALELPFAAIDASQLVPDGYAGSSVSSQLARLLQRVGRTSGHLGGVVFIDELDKLGSTGQRRFREQAAAGLLGLLNGDPVTVRDNPIASSTYRTDRLLVVAAGAFQSVRDEVRKRRNSSLGFHAASAQDLSTGKRATRDTISLEDIRDHAGLQPELIARFRRVATLEAPMPEDLAQAARRLGELKALVATTRKRRRVHLIFGASWFRRWAKHAASDAETSYRALHGPFSRVALHLMRALEARPSSRKLHPLLLTGDAFDTLFNAVPTNGWLSDLFAATNTTLTKNTA